MQKNDKVQHRQTKRIGQVHSFSKKHPGWIKVQWDGETQAFRYEKEDLEMFKCGREHSECPGYFCALPEGHAGVCLCN